MNYPLLQGIRQQFGGDFSAIAGCFGLLPMCVQRLFGGTGKVAGIKFTELNDL
jgi:hypothetical protein